MTSPSPASVSNEGPSARAVWTTLLAGGLVAASVWFGMDFSHDQQQEKQRELSSQAGRLLRSWETTIQKRAAIVILPDPVLYNSTEQTAKGICIGQASSNVMLYDHGHADIRLDPSRYEQCLKKLRDAPNRPDDWLSMQVMLTALSFLVSVSFVNSFGKRFGSRMDPT